MPPAERLLPPRGAYPAKPKDTAAIAHWISVLGEENHVAIRLNDAKDGASVFATAWFTKDAGKKLARRKRLRTTCASRLLAIDVSAFSTGSALPDLLSSVCRRLPPGSTTSSIPSERHAAVDARRLDYQIP